jgi:hypothetical protein
MGMRESEKGTLAGPRTDHVCDTPTAILAGKHLPVKSAFPPRAIPDAPTLQVHDDRRQVEPWTAFPGM